LLAVDGKPRGLLDMFADKPLAAADFAPIPSNALLALSARVDLDRSLDILLAGYTKSAGTGNRPNVSMRMTQAAITYLAILKMQYGVDIDRLVKSVGDTWCIYNSPTEGEVAFLGWTAVVPVRNRATLVDCCEKINAASDKARASLKTDEKKAIDLNFGGPLDFRKCCFAGHEIYYIAGNAVTPALCISDREMIITLNMPSMKAYLTRKDHRSLATQPGVALALKNGNRPACLWYCDAPRMFDFCYPVVSFYASLYAGAAHQANIDLDPTFWPSAPSIRAHLRPDITTVERTPHGLQLTSHYCLPSGGNGIVWLYGLAALGNAAAMQMPSMLGVNPPPPDTVPADRHDSKTKSATTSSANPYAEPATTGTLSPYSPVPETPSDFIARSRPIDEADHHGEAHSHEADTRTKDAQETSKSDGQTLPSSCYLQDDVQYYRPCPQFPLNKEAAALKAVAALAHSNPAVPGERIPMSPYVAKTEEDGFWNNRDNRLALRGPIKPGGKDADMDFPTEDETICALQKARPVQDSSKCTVERNRVRIVSELIKDSIDPPRQMPLVGPVQIHHVHFKTTVYFQETIHRPGQKPETDVHEGCQQVIYIDHDHLHRVESAESVASRSDSPKK
jgi:hypothetical protein